MLPLHCVINREVCFTLFDFGNDDHSDLRLCFNVFWTAVCQVYTFSGVVGNAFYSTFTNVLLMSRFYGINVFMLLEHFYVYDRGYFCPC